MNVTYCLPAHTDDRGSIQDIVQDGEFHHVTIIKSAAGSRRGDHYHLKTVQYVYLISGKLKALSRTSIGPVESATLLPGALLKTEPGEHHALIALVDSTFLVLTAGPRGGDQYESDTYRLDAPLSEPTHVW